MNFTSCTSYQTGSSALLQEFVDGHHEQLPLARAVTWPSTERDINDPATISNDLMVEVNVHHSRSLPINENRHLNLTRIIGDVLALLDDDDFCNDFDRDAERDHNSRTGDDEVYLALQEEDDDDDDEKSVYSVIVCDKELRRKQ
jgi:hypothetical protein